MVLTKKDTVDKVPKCRTIYLIVDGYIDIKTNTSVLMRNHTPKPKFIGVKGVLADPTSRMLWLSVELSVDGLTKQVKLVIDYHGLLINVSFVAPSTDPELNSALKNLNQDKIKDYARKMDDLKWSDF